MTNYSNDKYLTEEVNSYIQKRIPHMASSIVEARLPPIPKALQPLANINKPIVRALQPIAKRIGYGAQQMGSLVKELGYKVARDLQKSAGELKSDLHQIADTNLTKDENILLRKQGLDPDYVRQIITTYPTHAEVRAKYPKVPTNKSRREKYESLLNMAKERHEVETALTHARFMNPLLAKTMKSREESSTSELKNIAKRKQIAAKVDEYSKNIEAERRKRLVRARAFNIAKLRNK